MLHAKGRRQSRNLPLPCRIQASLRVFGQFATWAGVSLGICTRYCCVLAKHMPCRQPDVCVRCAFLPFVTDLRPGLESLVARLHGNTSSPVSHRCHGGKLAEQIQGLVNENQADT